MIWDEAVRLNACIVQAQEKNAVRCDGGGRQSDCPKVVMRLGGKRQCENKVAKNMVAHVASKSMRQRRRVDEVKEGSNCSN